jgi:hypothetical protein
VSKHTTAPDEFDPRVPLALERALVRHDYAVLWAIIKDDPERLRDGLEKLAKTVADNGATDCLDVLCDAHCDRWALLWLLHPFSRGRVFGNVLWSNKSGPSSIEILFGMTSKDLKKLLKKLKEVTSQLDIVDKQVEFSSLLKVSRELYPVSRLPKTLRTCAGVLQYAAKHFAGNAHIYDNIAKARLTSYVQATVESSYTHPRKRKRREFHDQQIAYLISAVSGDKDFSYDVAAHRGWRRKHYQRLRMLDPDIDQKLPRLIIPALEPLDP